MFPVEPWIEGAAYGGQAFMSIMEVTINTLYATFLMYDNTI
jgi:hypothetical protein